MMRQIWDPEQYLVFADERGRPFGDLIARIQVEHVTSVVDLGCGPGNLTALLAQRWPEADVVGIDSSPEMVARARADGVRFEVGDLRDWSPDEPVDVLVSNATLQWVPEHPYLLPQLIAGVRSGGVFAFQVPGNFGEPTHTARHELAQDPRFAPFLLGVHKPDAHDASVYLERLTALGCAVDAWETTYLHVLKGEDAVFTWVTGTGARATLQALPDEVRPVFEAEYRAALDAAYPPGPHGTLMSFRRIFVVATCP